MAEVKEKPRDPPRNRRENGFQREWKKNFAGFFARLRNYSVVLSRPSHIFLKFALRMKRRETESEHTQDVCYCAGG
jgi:hypothetical protein